MPGDRFLLIKASSSELWENVHHAVVMLLAAELTGRTPVIFWGTNCLFDGKLYNDAFSMYFEPVSQYTIYEVMRRDYSYYPPIWKHDNLMSDDPDKESNIYRNIGDLLASDANVVVSDTNISVKQLIPWIGKDHELYGMTPLMMYRRLMDRYIRPKSDIAAAVKSFRDKYINGSQPVLAVHMPGDLPLGIYPQISAFTKLNMSYHSNMHITRNDVFEVDETIDQHQTVRLMDAAIPQDPYKAYHPEIRKTLGRFAIKKMLLITDREDVIDEFKEEYGSMVFCSDCERIAAGDACRSGGLETFLSMRSKGVETLVDTYAAAACDFFIGYGSSELSHAVIRLRDWPETNFKLHYWMFSKLYNFTYQFVKTGRKSPEEADGRLRLIIKNAENSLRRVASVFK
ncbi:MAG: hypothetical protein ACM3S4_12445 [Burkholderiales bacterium]